VLHYLILIYSSGCAFECKAAYVTSHRSNAQFCQKLLGWNSNCVLTLLHRQNMAFTVISMFFYFVTWRLFPENTTAWYLSWICLCFWGVGFSMDKYKWTINNSKSLPSNCYSYQTVGRHMSCIGGHTLIQGMINERPDYCIKALCW